MIPVGAKPARRRYGPRKSTAQLALVAESTGGYEEDERYTQAVTLAVCRRLAGVDAYDLDVAACAEAHCASTWCSRENSGLEQEWFGNVWCNPPYSDIRPWIERAWQQMTDGSCVTVSMLLPSSRCEQVWWQQCVEPWRDREPRDGVRLTSHFLRARHAFGMPGMRVTRRGRPPFGLVLLVWRRA